MKQLFKLIGLFLLLPFAMQAQDKSSIQKMDSMIVRLYAKEDFGKCVEVLQKQQGMMEKQSLESDTAYFKNLRFQARCFWRLKKYDEAIASARGAVDNWAKYHDKDDRNYALMLDNLSLYLGNIEKPDTVEALRYSLEALQRYEKFMSNDEDLAIILLHVAENSYYCGKKQDAIKYELRALNLLKDLKGEHSDFYIGELEYLSTYYSGNGMKQKADEVAQLIEKLKKEQEKGIADLPPMMEFNSAEDCKAHVNDAYRYIDYYLSHLITADKMSDAAGYILCWTQNTDLVNVNLGQAETQLLASQKSSFYGVAYMAGCAKFAIETDSAEFSRDMYRYALVEVLNFYDGGNKDITGNVPLLEKLSQENKKKGSEALLALIDKYYDQLMKEVKKQEKSVNKR